MISSQAAVSVNAPAQTQPRALPWPAPDPPPFAAPWQAHAFALTLALHERGVFSWPQWTAALAAAIERAQARGEPDDGHTYYHHWLDALETLLLERGLADTATLHALEHAWEDAAARTPHGQPVVLPASALLLARRPAPA